MISLEEVKKLADLARLEVPAGELEKLGQDLESILGYVSELQIAPVKDVPVEGYYLKNVLRADVNPHESGIYTADLVKAFRKSKRDYLSVKPILDKNAG